MMISGSKDPKVQAIGRATQVESATTPAAVTYWREQAMRVTQRDAGELLAYSRDHIQHFELGRTRGARSRPAPVPLTVGLAMTALYVGLPPWTADGTGSNTAGSIPLRVLDRMRDACSRILAEEGLSARPGGGCRATG